MQKIRLYFNYYEDKDPERNKELREVFERNASSRLFGDAYDPGIEAIPGRPTYHEMFAQAEFYDDSINVFANADIFFDETLLKVRRLAARPSSKNLCLALSRWDVTRIDPFAASLHDHPDSQDVWIFFGRPKEMREASFSMGRPGCDNHLAWLLVQAGYEVKNPSRSIKAYHLHLSGVRNYLPEKGQGRGNPNKKGVVPGPYHFVPPQFIDL